jgi:hypothetical protein
MSPRALLRTLESVARKIGLEVRQEAFSPLQRSRGAECRVNGRTVLLVDALLSDFERACMVAEALGRRDLSGIALPPPLRDLIERGPRAPRTVPMDRLRPLAKARPRLRAEILPQTSG